MFLERLPLGALWTNGYLVWDDQGTGFFIDPGGDPQDILSLVDKRGVDLEFILLTHGHADHIGGLGAIRSRAKGGVLVHEDDASMLSRPESNLSAFVGGAIELAPADRLLKDGDVVSAGCLQVRVIHTPGHTRGSVCFLVGEEGEDPVLFSGDTLFAGSVGRSDLPGGDEGTLMASLKKLACLPDTTRVLPGHGPETTIGQERRHNPFWPGGRR